MIMRSARRRIISRVTLLTFSLGITFLIFCTLVTITSRSEVVENANKIVILFWTKFFGRNLTKDPSWKHIQMWLSTCPVKCRLSFDRSELNTSDAIVFHHTGIRLDDLPPHHLPTQPWVYFELEPPVRTGNLKEFDNLFNWVMTYRQDSDVPDPYVVTLPLERDSTPPDIREIISKKTKLVAWVASQCATPSNRETYVAQLSKHIQVDIYGKCGKYTCSSNRFIDPGCSTLISPKYKFYLAFENSHCQDYITEKFGNALRYHMVPIVYGGGNYSSVGPPDSYININDFASPKDLAAYLHHLDRNPNQYLRYFQWKLQYRVVMGGSGWCTLCTMMNLMKEEGQHVDKTYTNLGIWWRFGGNGNTQMCVAN